MSTQHLKRLVLPCSISIVLLVLLWQVRSQSTEKTLTIAPEATEESTALRLVGSRAPTQLDRLRLFQKSDFYRTIIDKNLFRPLGWTPQLPRETYRLLGTILPTDRIGRAPKAILEDTLRKQNRTFMIGDKLDADTTLIDIQPKQVTLEKSGHHRTVHLNTTPLLK